MKVKLKVLILSILGILWVSSSFAENNKGLTNSLLWKISKSGNPLPSYLFGTIHLICEQDYFWTPMMQKSFEQTSQLCIELDLDKKDLSLETASLMMDFSGGTLRDYFANEGDYNIVKKYIEDSLGQNMSIIERMKPVALLMIYSNVMIKGSCKETVSYELKLIEKTKEKNNPIYGLETIAEQMETLESIPTDSVINQLISIAKGEKNEQGEASILINAYKKQNLSLLNQLIVDSESGLNGSLLIDNRNKKWIAPMSKMMSEKPTFFAVGAGHLFGLLKLLRDAGYTVEAVKQ
jgi:uncharacterized protein YbaP (TraB family)